MTKPEKTAACYQHACLMYEDGKAINNQSVRERFEIGKDDSSVASRIIADTVEAGFIKPVDGIIGFQSLVDYFGSYALVEIMLLFLVALPTLAVYRFVKE